MNFEDFRADIEAKINLITDFELQEFVYQPYAFGNGLVAYRIKGRIHKFLFDGRDNLLYWYKSKLHQIYSDAKFTELRRFDGLLVEMEDLKNELIK